MTPEPNQLATVSDAWPESCTEEHIAQLQKLVDEGVISPLFSRAILQCMAREDCRNARYRGAAAAFQMILDAYAERKAVRRLPDNAP